MKDRYDLIKEPLTPTERPQLEIDPKEADILDQIFELAREAELSAEHAPAEAIQRAKDVFKQPLIEE